MLVFFQSNSTLYIEGDKLPQLLKKIGGFMLMMKMQTALNGLCLKIAI